MTPEEIREQFKKARFDAQTYLLAEVAAQLAELVLVGKSLEEKLIDFLATQPETEETRR